ncbi:PHD finger protein 14 [Homalodisca vitripennis]|nr:PHD finger protein 14 [Homalodisca vitripennis]
MGTVSLFHLTIIQDHSTKSYLFGISTATLEPVTVILPKTDSMFSIASCALFTATSLKPQRITKRLPFPAFSPQCCGYPELDDPLSLHPELTSLHASLPSRHQLITKFSFTVERDPTKRKVKPTPPSALIDFDLSGESSDDSDFRIEDHCEESDDDSLDSDDGGKQDADDSKSEEESDDSDENKISVEELLQQAESQKMKASGAVDPVKILICCVCLGDRSDANNEIVECDGCGVTVHEGCYGVSENDSISSTVSSCSTMPWFCEACRAGVDDPTCELCPNFGGIFKETDTGKWVHLVCALYIPGVAFGEVDKLSSVTLFEMAYTKWGARACSLCSDQRFTRTGVCVGCDAGLCRSYFHVTCGQREGLLSEAHSEEVDQADPFYAHCKLHSDKTLVKKRRRNWLALELRTAQRKKQYAMEGHSSLPEQLRIKRKLEKYKQKYCSIKFTRPPPWVPTQKMARPLTSDANVCRMLWRKASLSGVDTQAWALREAQTAALADVHRKWHIPPAFSVEFIGYYLDRNYRIESMKQQLSVLLEENAKLVEEQKEVQAQYDEDPFMLVHAPSSTANH